VEREWKRPYISIIKLVGIKPLKEAEQGEPLDTPG